MTLYLASPFSMAVINYKISITYMEQKLYYLDTFDCLTTNTGSGELDFPQGLKDLMDSGWYIAQISTSGYCTNNGNLQEPCILLLQREKAE